MAQDVRPEPAGHWHARALEHLQALVRIDTRNDGTGTGPGERLAAEYCARVLTDAGLSPTLHERSPGRTNLVVRLPGRDRSRPALLLHGHLDTVPADPAQWSSHPLSGAIRDGYVHGRGTVDMKNAVAMMLTVLSHRAQTGRAPDRDVVLALFSDEEAGYEQGSAWMVEAHPEEFAGCTEAISEVGGFSITTATGQRAYLLEVECKGVAYLDVTATGRSAHGSLHHSGSAVDALVAGLDRLARHHWAPSEDQLTGSFLAALATFVGRPVDGNSLGNVLHETGLDSVRGLLDSGVRNTVNATVLRAGLMPNVVPGSARAVLDGRFVAGTEDAFLATVRDVLGPDLHVEVVDHAEPVQSPHRSALVTALEQTMQVVDPGSIVIPFRNPASTDNSSLARLGIAGYGFVPLKLPRDYDFSGMFHGVDERIPVDTVLFGTAALDEVLDRV